MLRGKGLVTSGMLRYARSWVLRTRRWRVVKNNGGGHLDLETR